MSLFKIQLLKSDSDNSIFNFFGHFDDQMKTVRCVTTTVYVVTLPGRLRIVTLAENAWSQPRNTSNNFPVL